MKKIRTEFSKYFNGHVDTVTKRFLQGVDVAYDDLYIDVDFEESKAGKEDSVEEQIT